VLRPGGRPLAEEMRIHPDDWARLPAEFRASVRRLSPAFVRGFAEEAQAAGFAVLEDLAVETRPISPSESGFAEQAKGYGVDVRGICTKTVAVKA